MLFRSICCMRSKMDHVQEKDERGRTVVKKVGMAPIMRDGIEYEFTTVFDVATNHTASVSKDRTSLFSDKIFQITEETGRQMDQWRNAGEAQPSTPAATAPTGGHQERLVTALANDEAAANAYLKKIGWIVDGQTFVDVTPDRAEKILNALPAFVAKINGQTPAA